MKKTMWWGPWQTGNDEDDRWARIPLRKREPLKRDPTILRTPPGGGTAAQRCPFVRRITSVTYSQPDAGGNETVRQRGGIAVLSIRGQQKQTPPSPSPPLPGGRPSPLHAYADPGDVRTRPRKAGPGPR